MSRRTANPARSTGRRWGNCRSTPKAKPPGPGGQWRPGPAESAPDGLGSGQLPPTGITSVFSVEELEKLKPRIGSRLVDGMTVNWPAVSATSYRDQRR